MDLNAFTHFAVSPFSPKGFIFFNLDKCENCGKTIYNSAEATPNVMAMGGLKGGRLKARCIAAGWKFMDEMPPDMTVDFHDNDDGEEEWGCEDCM